MKLIVIIPALNEEKTIARVIRGIPEKIQGLDRIEVLVIDDGSTDQTAGMAEQAGARVIRHKINRGVGAAFRTGIEAGLAAGADVIVNMDGDGQFDPGTITDLVKPILEDRADFVTCTRFAVKELIPVMPIVKLWGNRQVTRIINLITGRRFTDVSCGFRAYTRECAMHLNLFGQFTYTQETFIDLVRKNVRMTEVPLPVRGEREFGKSRVASSIPRYAYRSGSIILLTVRDNRPLIFFGVIGLVVTLFGVAAGAFVTLHWALTGHTSPFQSMVTLSAVLLILGFLLMIMALIADMLGRLRANQDELLFLQRQQLYGPGENRADKK